MGEIQKIVPFIQKKARTAEAVASAMTTCMCGYASQREYRAFQTKCVSKVIDNSRDNLFYALFFIVVVIVSVVLIDALVFCRGS